MATLVLDSANLIALLQERNKTSKLVIVIDYYVYLLGSDWLFALLLILLIFCIHIIPSFNLIIASFGCNLSNSNVQQKQEILNLVI